MENQHQKIKGYRDLSQGEIDLMNKIKAHGDASAALSEEVRQHVIAQHEAAKPTDTEEIETKSAEMSRLAQADPLYWLHSARQDMQIASMKLVRAVAQPTTF